MRKFIICLIGLFLLVGNKIYAYDFQYEGIYYSINADKTTVSVVSGDVQYQGDIVIPSSVRYNSTDYVVTSVSGFNSCYNVKSLSISHTITSIKAYDFMNCGGLISIVVDNNNPVYDSRNGCNAIIETANNKLILGCQNTVIPNTVKIIGDRAFDGCTGLTEITIPNSVISMEEYVFSHSGITSITIPSNLTSINLSTFYMCDYLKHMIVEKGNPVYDSRDNCNAIIETATNTLYIGCKNSTIPKTVETIGRFAFTQCYNLTSIDIPNNVKRIEDCAFQSCPLTSLYIPASVDSIEYGAFQNCDFTSIKVDTNNHKYDSRNNCNAIIESTTNSLILGCKNTVLLNSVISIGSRAFHGCKSLTSVTIPNSVISIGNEAFAWCSGLTSITIPNSVNKIVYSAFSSCRALKSVKSKIRNPFKIEANVFRDLPTDAELTIPYGTKSRYMTTEGWNVFSKTTEEELADGVVFVGKIANDKELDFMIISNNGKTCQVGDGIVCATINLTEAKFVIPDIVNGYTVMAISSNAFHNCSALKSVTIPSTVTSIGDGAFAGCSGLTSILSKIETPFAINENVFPQKAYSATLYVPLGTKNQYLATAGWNQFKEIIEIATRNGQIFTDDVNGVTMSFKVTDIDNLKCQFGSGEESAISQSVTSFSIPSEAKGLTVSGIADNAIANCASLLSITFPETIETVGSNVLAGCTNLAVIKWNAERAVPDALTSGVNNPNLLLYVKDKSYGPATVKNVVANGTADEIVLKETDGGNNFYCPEAFTAKRISFVHNYSMESGYKECRGWETIVLPFDVTSIMSETGSYVVPRSAWTAGDTQQRPFFLYEWTTAGWQPATAIKANIPYIICMPNNENYDPIYQLKGDFEFTGTNVQVFSTDEIGTVVYRNKRFVPNYLNKEASQSMLPLNVNNLWDKNTKADYTEGSAFLRGLRAVRPFEAYMMMEEGMAAPMAIPVFGDGTPTGIDALLVNNEEVNSESWYSLDGRKLQGKPTTKGVYILNGRKVVVK